MTIMPAKGCATPQTRFWMAMASAKVSRLQPFSVVKGVRKKPMVERGPKPIAPIRQPAPITIGAERQNVRADGMLRAVTGRVLPGGTLSVLARNIAGTNESS